MRGLDRVVVIVIAAMIGCSDPDDDTPGGACGANQCAVASGVDGACVLDGTVNPANTCEECDPVRSATGWSPRLDTCVVGGTCYQAGQPAAGATCLTCQPDVSRTELTIAANTCAVAGACYAADEPDPANDCQRCDPVAAEDAFTIDVDPAEPNNAYSNARSLGASTSCDADAVSGTGILAGFADEDWFSTMYTDATACLLDPQLTVSSGGQMVEACVFTRCAAGANVNDTLDCLDGSTAGTNAASSLGCCKSGVDPTFHFDPNCAGTLDDSGTAYVVVRSLAVSAPCATFDVTVRF